MNVGGVNSNTTLRYIRRPFYAQVGKHIDIRNLGSTDYVETLFTEGTNQPKRKAFLGISVSNLLDNSYNGYEAIRTIKMFDPAIHQLPDEFRNHECATARVPVRSYLAYPQWSTYPGSVQSSSLAFNPTFDVDVNTTFFKQYERSPLTGYRYANGGHGISLQWVFNDYMSSQDPHYYAYELPTPPWGAVPNPKPRNYTHTVTNSSNETVRKSSHEDTLVPSILEGMYQTPTWARKLYKVLKTPEQIYIATGKELCELDDADLDNDAIWRAPQTLGEAINIRWGSKKVRKASYIRCQGNDAYNSGEATSSTNLAYKTVDCFKPAKGWKGYQSKKYKNWKLGLDAMYGKRRQDYSGNIVPDEIKSAAIDWWLNSPENGSHADYVWPNSYCASCVDTQSGND